MKVSGLERDVIIEKREENLVRIRVRGETHTLGNLIAKELQRREDVELAYYNIEHPLERSFVLLIRTKKGRDPLEVLQDSLRSLREKLDRLEEVVRGALKGGQARG
uniref:DNA-directed RNA polymerase subunit Rpo11 n=1 Tax=Fervidicoccus fontis TaxID=683846 RepID=A0A7J3ZJL9_9CREN